MLKNLYRTSRRLKKLNYSGATKETLIEFLSTDSTVVIYGAGALGRHAKLICKICGIRPVAFIDNFKSGKFFDISICNYTHFRQAYPSDTKVIIAISGAEEEIAKQLSIDGFTSHIKLYSSMMFAEQLWLENCERWITNSLSIKITEDIEQNKNAVLLLTQSLSPGGAERQWCYLAKGLKQAGLAVTLVVIERLEENLSFYHYLLEGTGIGVISLEDEREIEATTGSRATNNSAFCQIVNSQPNLFDPVTQFGARLTHLIKIVCTLKPAAIVCQLDEPNILGAIASSIIGCKPILSFRNVSPVNFLPQTHQDYVNLLGKLYRAIIKIHDLILTGNSKSGNEDYAKWINIDFDRIHQIPNIIPQNTTITPSLTKTIRSLDKVNPPVITGVFRLAEEKNPRHFVEVCSRLRDRGIDFKARIVGDGPLKQEIMMLIQQSKLSETIALTGIVRDVDEILRTSALCLHTAIFEGMPNVIVEALAVGCPVVTSGVGEIPNIVVQGKNGFIVNPFDTDGFVIACESILCDANLRDSMSDYALESIRDLKKKADPVKAFLKLLRANGPNEAKPISKVF